MVKISIFGKTNDLLVVNAFENVYDNFLILISFMHHSMAILSACPSVTLAICVKIKIRMSQKEG